MSTEQNITANIKVPNKDLEALRTSFPQCFDKGGNFQLEKFKNNLSEKEINFSTESYGLDWLGKSYARLLASDPATTLLKADDTHNGKPENANAGNLLLKGDNLEVLKHLSNACREQIKMIYIDPPYNTGSDGFVYEDDRKFTVKELQNLTGVEEEKAQRILSFTQSRSNSHSAWLTFMYPRLYIAKQLLKEDGVIFISIDDNEVAQLRLLMDEVFGEENFVANIVWQKKYAATNDAQGFSNLHDHIIVYSKTNKFERRLLPRTDELNKPYKNDDGDGKGLWRSDNILVKSFSESGVYPIVNPTTAEKHFPPKGSSWRASKETMQKWLLDNRVFFGKDGKGAPQLKRYLNEVQNGIVPTTWWRFEDVGHNDAANKEVTALFDTKTPFDTPKPTKLIIQILKISSDSDSIILDFFAGSGTTGDAVMQLNAEDGGNRKFILVQLPEEIDQKKNKAAFDFVKDELQAEPTIFEITKERLLRAAKKINTGLDDKIAKLKSELPTEENNAKIDKLELCKTQNIFKIFETTPIWEDYDFESDELTGQTTLFDESKLTETDMLSLLLTWKTYDGIPLTRELVKVDLAGYSAYFGNGKLYLMDKGFKTDHLKNLLEKIDSDKAFNPTSIIAFGYHFDSKNLRELSENVKSYANRKESDIDFITRY